jgi:hypothetical protein
MTAAVHFSTSNLVGDSGAEMLAVQPAMGAAAVADVAAAMAQGTVMHKAWVHSAGRRLAGSKR